MMENKIRVLYVDDEHSLLDLGKLFLEREGGFVVETLTSAQLALEQLKTERYDAIISDYQMPEMDGIAFLRQLKASGNTTPFIIFTGRGREEVVIEALNNGADFYLQKGGEQKSQFAELSNNIRYAVSRKRAEEILRESEERYRSVVNDQTEMIVRFTPDGVITFVNEAYHSYFTPLLDLQDVEGKNIRDIMQIRNFSEVEKFLSSLTRETPTREMERRFTAQDGNEYWQIWSVRALFGTDGRSPEYQVVGRDITERKQVEAALQKSEEKYRAIFYNTGAATIIIAPDTTILLANAGWEKLTGVSRADQENKLRWTQFIDKNDVERMKQYHYARRKGSSLIPTVYECRVINANKMVHTCVVHVDMIQGTKNSVASLVDITERRKAEDELQAAYEQLTAAEEELQAQYDELKFSQERIKQDEAKYREIIENIQECYYRTDVEGTLVLVNPSGAVLLGYSSVSELQGKNIATTLYVNPEERKIFLAEIEKTGSVSNFEVLLKKQDGTLITILTSSHKYYDTDGKYLGIEGIFRDITERKRAEAALRASEDKFSKTFQSSPDLILLTSIPEGKILEVNESVLRITGYTQEEVQGRTIDELGFWVDGADREQYKARIRTEGKVLNFPTRFRQKSGAIITAWISGSIASLESGPCFISVVNDITDQKRAEDALRESELFLKETQQIARLGGWKANPHTDYLGWTDGIYDIIKAPRDYHPGLTEGLKYYAPEDIPVIREKMAACLAAGEPFAIEVQIITETGKKVWTELRGLAPVIEGARSYVLGTLQDITEQKRVEKSLRESGRQLNSMATNIPGVVYRFCVNPDGTYGFDYISERSRQILGLENDPVTFFSRVTEGIIPEDRERFISSVQHAINTKTLWEFDGWYVKPSGKKIWFSAVSSPVTEDERLVFDGVVFNNTDRKRAEEELLKKNEELNASYEQIAAAQEELRANLEELTRQELALRGNEEKYRTVFENTGTATVVLEESGIISLANEQFAQLCGFSKDAIEGKKFWTEFVVKEDLERMHVQHRLRRQDEVKALTHYEFRFVTKTGDIRNIYLSIGVIPGTKKSVASLLDITGRKRAEELYLTIFENMGTAMIILEEDTTISHVNDEMEKISGYSREEIEGRVKWPTLVATEDIKKMLEYHHLRRTTPDSAPRNYEFRLIHKTGKVRDAALIAAIIPGTKKSVISISDITERKKTEQALHEANKKLTLLSSLTRHDINNQLTVLQGYLDVLEQMHPDLTHKDYFQKVSTAAQRISSMIQFTKEYEKIGVNAPIWKDCRTIVDIAAKEAPLGKVMVKNDLPAGAEVFADPLIVKVFYNLMDNAVRYGGKITIIQFSVQEAGDDHLIVCEDDGDGVVAEEKEKIFERGFGKNTGLGLALSREILSITGITITENGELGKGARFEMMVPEGAYRFMGTK